MPPEKVCAKQYGRLLAARWLGHYPVTTPLVSIITPVYNSSATLDYSLQSAINQKDIDNWELLLIDDCSSDDSPAILENLQAKDKRIRVFQTPVRSGPAEARNLGLQHARSRHIAFLDADDWWHPAKLRQQLSALHLNPQAVLCHTGSYRIRLHNSLVGSKVTNAAYHTVRRRTEYKHLTGRNPIHLSSVMIDKTRCKHLRMPSIPLRQDYALWFELLRHQGAWAIGINRPLTHILRGHNNSTSRSKTRAAKYQWHVYVAREKFNYLHAAYNFSRYAVSGLVEETKLKVLKPRRGISLQKEYPVKKSTNTKQKTNS